MGTPSKIQNSFTGGELSPELFGRTDLAKWQNGASTMRNFYVSYRGGASSRAGTAFVGQCLNEAGIDGSNPPPRDIKFQFNVNQGYPLEFGEQVVTRAVTGAANSGGLIRLAVASTRGLMTGFTTVVSGVVGTTEANGTWVITVVDATHIDLQGSTFANAYVSGGTTVTDAGYMRVKSNGAYVVEDTNPITAITQANPGVFTYTATNYTLQDGDWIYVTGVGGMTNFNGLVWVVYNRTGTNFSVMDLFGVPIDTTTFTAYTSGGTLARIYTTPSPYAAIDLPYLKFTQSADTMSLCCVNQQTGTEYPPYDLVRNDATDWVFTEVSFGSSISAPTGAFAVAHNSTTTSTWYSYVVTAIDSSTGEESVASNTAGVFNNDIAVNAGSNTISWQPVSGASSYNVYKSTPSYSVGVPVGVSYGYIGTAFGTEFTDTNIIADFTKVPPVHNNPFAVSTITAVNVTAGGAGLTQATAGYSVTTSTGSGFAGSPVIVAGALAAFIIENGGENYDSSDTITIGIKASGSYDFTSGNPINTETIVLNGVTWTFVTGTPTATQTKIQSTLADTLYYLVQNLNASSNSSLNVASYTLSGNVVTITYDTIGTGGNAYTIAAGTYGGTPSGGTLTGGSTSTGATATLTVGPDSGTYPGCVAYFQQRRVYASTQNKPDTYFMSQPGAYTNFDTAVPLTDDMAIIGAPWAQQINGIQFMIASTTGLLMFTGNGIWLLNGGDQGQAITPSNQNAQSQAYNGCHDHVQPIMVNFDTLYVQSKGSIIRDLAYNFFNNIFTGTDLTVLSSHLFNYQQITQWAYAEEPYKLIWCVRDDGALLCLTYLKEQDVYGWSRHDSNGLFVGVCSVTEPPVDAVYAIVKRYVNGQWKYYSERMDNRNWTNAESTFCVDCGLSTALTYPDATLVPAASRGTGNISSVMIINGGSGYTAPVVAATSGTGSGATFSVSLTGDVITGITVLTEGEDYLAGGVELEITDTTGSGAVLHAVVTNNVTFTTDASVFTSDSVGDVIRIGNNNASPDVESAVTLSGSGKAVITSYVSGTEVVANIIEPITAIIYDNEEEMPVPAISGQWSIATPVDEISGLNHLEGMTVAIVADGGVEDQQVVENGMITLQHEASLVVVGLPFTAQLQGLYIEPPDTPGTVQGKRKDISSVVARVVNSRAYTGGTNQPDQSMQPRGLMVPWTGMIAVKERNASVECGNAVPLYSGDSYVNVLGGWSEYGQTAIEVQDPMPVNCLALVTAFTPGDT